MTLATLAPLLPQVTGLHTLLARLRTASIAFGTFIHSLYIPKPMCQKLQLHWAASERILAPSDIASMSPTTEGQKGLPQS